MEEDEKLSCHLMKLEGVRIVCPYPRLNLDPLLRQWELPIVKEARTINKIELDG